MTQDSRCDVVVVGGGPAGSATAIALTERGLSTTVVVGDACRSGTDRIGESVPPEIEPLLARLALGDEFRRDGHLPAAATASSWGTSELAWRDGFTSATGAGWHLSRGRFDEMLLREAARRRGRVLRGGRVVALTRLGDEGWSVTLRARDGGVGELNAPFMVDATGRAAVVARRLGAVRVVDDDLVCVYGALEAAGASAYPDTVVESVEDGWWYAARLPDGRWMTALFTDRAVLRLRGAAGRDGWYRLLASTAHVFPLLGQPAAPAKVHLVSARSQRLGNVAGKGWLAVGDAAMAWDPLTSAGIVQALRSGLRASEAVAGILRGDERAGPSYQAEHVALHARYLAERRAYYAIEHRWPHSPFWQRRAERRGV